MRQDYSYQHDTSLPEVPAGTYVDMTDHDKALCFDEICRMVQAHDKAIDKLAEDTKGNYDEWAKGLSHLRESLSTQVQMISLRSLKVKDEEYFINDSNGNRIFRKDYATVDIEKTLDRFCKWLESRTNVPWKWGRDVYVTGKRCRDFNMWIKGGDEQQFEFYCFGDEFTPYWDDWWWFLNSGLPSFLTPKQEYYCSGRQSCINKDEIYLPDTRVDHYDPDPSIDLKFKNDLYGVKNAKDISDRLTALGF